MPPNVAGEATETRFFDFVFPGAPTCVHLAPDQRSPSQCQRVRTRRRSGPMSSSYRGSERPDNSVSYRKLQLKFPEPQAPLSCPSPCQAGTWRLWQHLFPGPVVREMFGPVIDWSEQSFPLDAAPVTSPPPTSGGRVKREQPPSQFLLSVPNSNLG